MDPLRAPSGTSPDEPHPAADSAPDTTPRFPIVAVGASAGGLDAFGELLRHLPTDTGMAFVLIQHLDPRHESLLSGILGRATTMPVEVAEQGATLAPDTVYVMPADVTLTLRDRVLHLAPRRPHPTPNHPIDEFFHSLAESRGPQAIGVVLSGTGADGVRGVESIKAEGGITFAQDDASAQYTAMPRHARETGCVDFVMTPEGIAAELARLAKHPGIAAATASGEGTTELDDEELFRALYALLRPLLDVDLSLYRQTTLRRRVLRRMALLRISSLEEYVRHVEADHAEAQALAQDVLIRVTRFFRDPALFTALEEQVFPRLLRDRAPQQPIRIWVAGCATGEEAYSLAISLTESMERAGVHVPVQIFASDISPSSIAVGRAAAYSRSIADDVSAERLARWFVETRDGYQVCKRIRETCVFAIHDLIGDPPFSRLDLISCRNVLIYLHAVQARMLSTFHFALVPGGTLVLGGAESTAASADLFATEDAQLRIFTRRAFSRTARPAVARSSRGASDAGGSPLGDRAWRPGSHEHWRAQADRLLLIRYVPAAVMTNAELEVLEVRGNITPYLEHSPGTARLSLLSMARKSGLAGRLSAAINAARTTGTSVRVEQIPLGSPDADLRVNIEVVPVDSGATSGWLVLFEPSRRDAHADDSASPYTPSPATTAGDAARLEVLRIEVGALRVQLAELLEEQDEKLELSRSAVEEAQSNAEELQSMNEELETTKEELEATNEELSALNSELENRNGELERLRRSADAIVATIHHPLLVLSPGHDVRAANAAFYGLFAARPEQTVDRSLFEVLAGRLDVEHLRAGLDSTATGDLFRGLELKATLPNGRARTLLLNARRIPDLDLVLLAMEDVTDFREAQAKMHAEDERRGESQKMEAVGRLAGGVAHDFNNILTVMLGFSDLLLTRLSETNPARADALEVRAAAERAAAITRQLLMFSRRQVPQMRRLDLSQVVLDMEKVMLRLIGEHIRLVVRTPAPPLWMMADPGQLGQIVMNLSLNARDAMSPGGTLEIETAAVTVGEDDPAPRSLAPGRYVLLRVEDTGEGMEPEVLAHCFEPFFTTKDVGRGTGLGLATVFGIVQRTGGHIRARSALGVGTAFEIHWPVEEHAVAVAPNAPEPESARPGGVETILLVEDEDAIRRLARSVLETKGYRVFEAADGIAALEWSEAHTETVQLLVTDVVMPRMGGRRLAEKLSARVPGLRVLFVSGHTEDTLLGQGVEKGVPFLHKPFTPAELLRKVRDVLDAKITHLP